MNEKLLNKQNLTQEKGITFIALIITIIILVILAAVSVRAVYENGILKYAVNGTQRYIEAAVEENEMLDSIVAVLDNTTKKIRDKETEHTSLNEYGFYFDIPYSIIMPGNVKMSGIFKENGAGEIYKDNAPYMFLNEGECDYTTTPGSIIIMNAPCEISDDGLSVTFPGVLVDALLETNGCPAAKVTCSFEEYHHVYLGEKYYIKKYASDFNDLVFNKDKISSIDTLDGHILESSINIPYSSYSNSHVIILGETEGLYISMDGNELYIGNNGVIENTEFATRSTPLTPRIVAWDNNTEAAIRGGNPENGDSVIYDEYFYQYIDASSGYVMCVKDKTKTSYGEIPDYVFEVPVKSISFYECTALTTATTIPSTVTSMVGAFEGCTSLTSVTIPSSVTDINGAFYGCTNLHTVNYSGTVEQWEAITNKSYWNHASGIETVVCSDGTISVTE